MSNISDALPEHQLLGGELGGDALEQALWPHLRDRFPRYEVLWSEFIWTLTNRAYQARGSRLDIHHFRPELMARQPMLIWFAQAHYTTFRCLSSIWMRVHHWTPPAGEDASPQATLANLLHLDRLNDVYRLIGSVDDMVSILAHTVERLEEAASGVQPPTKLNAEEIQRLVDRWMSEDYGWQYEDFCRMLKPVTIPVHGRGDSLARLLPDALGKRYRKFRQRAVQYRNLLHRPHPAQMWRGNGHWVPKPECLSEYAYWPKMASVTDAELKSKFQPAEDALKRDAAELVDLLNEVWSVLIARMRKLGDTPAFKGWVALVPEESPESVKVLIPAEGMIEGMTSSAYFPPARSDRPVGLSGVKANPDGMSLGGWSRIQSGLFSQEEDK